jgi:hypothetical protein
VTKDSSMSRTRAGMLLVLVCSTLLLVGDPVVGQTQGSPLAGKWQLSLWVTGATTSTGPRAARGDLELRRLDLGSAGSAGSDVYSVAYDTTLHVMFGAPRAGPAQAGLKGAGMVELAFNPFLDHGAFRLSGVLRGDSIVGEWLRTNFADDGYLGAFRMVRTR